MPAADSMICATLARIRHPCHCGWFHLLGRRLLLTVVCLLLSLSPAIGGAADLEELEEIIDEARLTFARFTGHPKMAWFRERARSASAIFIAPDVTRIGYFFGAAWGTGVLLVRDASTGRWSEPAFYRLAGGSFGLQIGVLDSEIIALATDEQAAAEMHNGTFALGIGATLGAGQFGGGIKGSLETTTGAGVVTVSAPTGLFAGIAVGGAFVLVRDGANELYYGRPVELDDLRQGRTRQWYSERLVNAVTEVVSSARELSP